MSSSQRKFEIIREHGEGDVGVVSKCAKLQHHTCGEQDDDQASLSNDSVVDADKSQDIQYPYGNYPSYYGYRNKGLSQNGLDPRLELIIKALSKGFFRGKRVLDIGCNSGLVTVQLGQCTGLEYIIGVDIDPSLIKKARHQLMFRNSLMKAELDDSPHVAALLSDPDHEWIPLPEDGLIDETIDNCCPYYPISMPTTFGCFPAVDIKKWKGCSSFSSFPHNVHFKCTNWIGNNMGEIINTGSRSAVDVILCLSVTKWIHLNWGDEGIKRLFFRIFRELGPGGVLILEWQPFETYKKKAPSPCPPVDDVKLKPELFCSYLLNDVGFSSLRRLVPGGASYVKDSGFNRPVDIFVKPLNRDLQ